MANRQRACIDGEVTPKLGSIQRISRHSVAINSNTY